jgi:hypothetical protein
VTGGVVLPSNDEVEVYSESIHVMCEVRTVVLYCH